MPKVSSRLLRRVVIAMIFLTVFFIFGYGTQQFTQTPPTCTDGIMNGEEEGIDCGLFACQNYCEPDLEPPQVVSTKLIQAGDRDYDFVAEIKNPHIQFGASEVVYELVLFNGDDEESLREEGIFYILPGQTKFFILPHLTTEKNITRHELNIISAKWQRIESLEGINFVIKSQNYIVSGGGSSSKLVVIVANASDYDFERVDADIIVRDYKGEIIAVNKSNAMTFRAGTERHFDVAWPFRIKGVVDTFDIMISTNLFENSNFIKRYGSKIEKFQDYTRKR